MLSDQLHHRHFVSLPKPCSECPTSVFNASSSENEVGVSAEMDQANSVRRCSAPPRRTEGRLWRVAENSHSSAKVDRDFRAGDLTAKVIRARNRSTVGEKSGAEGGT